MLNLPTSARINVIVLVPVLRIGQAVVWEAVEVGAGSYELGGNGDVDCFQDALVSVAGWVGCSCCRYDWCC